MRASTSRLVAVVAAKRTHSETVKTTVELPGDLWRAAKIRAMDERSDLRSVLVRALEQYLDESSTPVTAPASREGR
jgi:hypothetical protein